MKATQHRRPLWLGSLLAALVPPICLTAPFSPFAPGYFGGVVAIFAAAFPTALIAVLALGLPYVLWLRAHSRLNAPLVCLGASGVGAITVALLNLGLNWGHCPPGVLQLGYGAGLGLVAGVVFCLGAGIIWGGSPPPPCLLHTSRRLCRADLTAA